LAAIFLDFAGTYLKIKSMDISQFLQTNVQVELFFLELLALLVDHLDEMLDEVQVMTRGDVVVSSLSPLEPDVCLANGLVDIHQARHHGITVGWWAWQGEAWFGEVGWRDVSALYQSGFVFRDRTYIKEPKKIDTATSYE
jgi:hypothetical protein